MKNKPNSKEKAVTFPILIDEYAKKTETFNGGELFWLFEPPLEVQEEWERRVVCALCFAKKFFADNKVALLDVPYRIYLSSTYTETKSLLFEHSGGKFFLQPNAASAVLGGGLFAEQKAKMNDVHEYVHILMDNFQLRASKKESQVRPVFPQPMWYREGLAQYVQGKKEGGDYCQKARERVYLLPITLAAMNLPCENLWMEFGIMEFLVATGNHPGLTAGASFIQFLAEKEGLGFKAVWDLASFQGTQIEFYQEIERLCQSSFSNLLNNYLYYVDQPFLSEGQKNWSMPVAVARDFRGEFVFEEKEFEILINV